MIFFFVFFSLRKEKFQQQFIQKSENSWWDTFVSCGIIVIIRPSFVFYQIHSTY